MVSSARMSDQLYGWRFTAAGDGLASAVDQFLRAAPEAPRLLGFGEPTHGIEAFPLLRNLLLEHLVENRGFRSIALETDCLSALTVDEFVRTGRPSLGQALESGFSHGLGDVAANRELLGWLRDHNGQRSAAEQVRFYGFDSPTEISGANSPRTALLALFDYLATHLDPARIPHTSADFVPLLGDDEDWENPAAALDPAQSIGDSTAVLRLRAIVDDLANVLTAEAPHLLESSSRYEYERACLCGRAASGLLRYHAAMADDGPNRWARLASTRDAMMADNLTAIAAAEADRGPTLVFAHNAHLKRTPAGLHLAYLDLDVELTWWSAGAIAATRLGRRYSVIASDFGSVDGVPDAGPESLHAFLADSTPDRALYPANTLTTLAEQRNLTARTDAPYYYGPLAPHDLTGVDAVAFIAQL